MTSLTPPRNPGLVIAKTRVMDRNIFDNHRKHFLSRALTGSHAHVWTKQSRGTSQRATWVNQSEPELWYVSYGWSKMIPPMTWVAAMTRPRALGGIASNHSSIIICGCFTSPSFYYLAISISPYRVRMSHFSLHTVIPLVLFLPLYYLLLCSSIASSAPSTTITFLRS